MKTTLIALLALGLLLPLTGAEKKTGVEEDGYKGRVKSVKDSTFNIEVKDGKPVKKNYRKYNIKTITGIDDFASVREVVIRRYKRLLKEKSSLPDLILIDGGKGQLSMAISALSQLGIAYVPVIGLAKRLEEVFLPGQSEPQSISKSSPGLLLLRRVRDEAHRFAVSFQR